MNREGREGREGREEERKRRRKDKQGFSIAKLKLSNSQTALKDSLKLYQFVPKLH